MFFNVCEVAFFPRRKLAFVDDKPGSRHHSVKEVADIATNRVDEIVNNVALPTNG